MSFRDEDIKESQEAAQSLALLPADVLERLEVTAQQEMSGEFVEDQYMDEEGRPAPGPFDRGRAYGPVVYDIVCAESKVKEAWLAALAREVVPRGGLATVGAAQTVVRTLGIESMQASDDAATIVDASLDFQRSQGTHWAHLSIFEQNHWRARRPDVPWYEEPLDPRPKQVTNSEKQTLFVSVYGSSERPEVFVSKESADAWVEQYHSNSDWAVYSEIVLQRLRARVSWDGLVETAKKEGWYQHGPQPDPPDQGAPDSQYDVVYAAHAGITCFVHVDKSDEEANTFLGSLSPLAPEGYSSHEVELRSP